MLRNLSTKFYILVILSCLQISDVSEAVTEVWRAMDVALQIQTPVQPPQEPLKHHSSGDGQVVSVSTEANARL